MKLFLAIVLTLAGIVLLIGAIGDIRYLPQDGGETAEAFFAIVFLAGGITWLRKLRVPPIR